MKEWKAPHYSHCQKKVLFLHTGESPTYKYINSLKIQVLCHFLHFIMDKYNLNF